MIILWGWRFLHTDFVGFCDGAIINLWYKICKTHSFVLAHIVWHHNNIHREDIWDWKRVLVKYTCTSDKDPTFHRSVLDLFIPSYPEIKCKPFNTKSKWTVRYMYFYQWDCFSKKFICIVIDFRIKALLNFAFRSRCIHSKWISNSISQWYHIMFTPKWEQAI